MRLLDAINPYPITEPLNHSPWDTEEKIQQMNQSLRTVNNPGELAIFMAHSKEDNSLPNALHEGLQEHEPYKTAKRLTPFLKDSPAITRYRNSYKTHDPIAVIKEILRANICLPAGQVLFHGGPWLGSTSPPPVDTKFASPTPFSTTLCPQVAAVHALYEPRGFLWHITLCDPTPCFVFNNKNRRLGHEFEVLLPPIQFVCAKIDSSGMDTALLYVSAQFET